MYMHLTNYAINKTNANCQKPKEENDTNPFKRSKDEVFEDPPADLIPHSEPTDRMRVQVDERCFIHGCQQAVPTMEARESVVRQHDLNTAWVEMLIHEQQIKFA